MDKGIELVRKVKADINDLVDIINSDKGSQVVEQAVRLIKQNEAWLSEWEEQNKVAMGGNNNA
jgi:hypothetical protein